MKKYNTSKFTIITALMLSASLLLSGCAENSIEVTGGGENGDETVTETGVTEAVETTPAVTVSEETTEPVTSAAVTEAAVTEETIKETEKTAEATVTASVTPSAPAAWTETAASGTMYINTNGVYSRKEAVQGSARVKQYSLNEAVTVTAKTDTSYYKLSDGAFVHADYLSSNKVTVTTAATASKPAVTTTAAQQSKPSDQDRSYLNLSNSDVQYILNECQKYAKSLGYRVVTYSEYEKSLEEMQRKTEKLSKEGAAWDEIQAVLDEFNSDLRYITNVSTEDFWSGNWHNIIYAGNFTTNGSHDGNGYDLHCGTKQESIDWIIVYLKNWIDVERSNLYQEGGRSISIAGTGLQEFDNYGRKNDGVWGMVSYDDIHWEYSSYHKFDLNTSYAFSVKFY